MNRLGATTLLLLVLSACGGITVAESIDQFAPSYCAKLKSCYGSEYQQAYPNGDSACVDTFKRGLTENQLDGKSTCVQEELGACLTMISALECGKSITDTPVPAECTCK